QLRKAFPQAIEGGEPGMTPVFRTDRYVLVEVSETRPAQRRSDGTGSVPQSTPRPVTPRRPANPEEGGAVVTPATPSPGEQDDTGTSPAAPQTSPQPGSGTGTGGTSAPQLEGE
ncbi:MAG: hypothetical protein M3Y45_04880, partial [Actinomycetota bacterium]|nr:hypothetical protein [Actinomycetota bacterium]